MTTTASQPDAAHRSSSRAIVLGAAEGRTPAPLNVVGEETLVKVGPADSDGQLAAFHLVAPPMSGPPLHVSTCTRVRTSGSTCWKERSSS